MLEKNIKRLAGKFPVVSVTGPRQSGKTTTSRACFPKHSYLNLEIPDLREEAFKDPRAFLNHGKSNLLIDEAQYAPHLFSYIQAYADENKRMGQFVLSGSQNFLLLEKISQSLAGRTAILHLLPFCINELKQANLLPSTFNRMALKGFYPSIYDRKINPEDFYAAYINTYVQRDVRQITGVHNLLSFQQFLSLCAGRTGQLLNYASLGNDAGIDQKTAMAWLSVLEASFIIFRVPAFHRNFKKRIIKSPKLYFHDTGLACYLLGIKNEEQMKTHFHKGAIFENLVMSEIIKLQYNKAVLSPVYFWRDSTGHEIDCIVGSGKTTKSVEIKSGSTLKDSFFENLRFFKKIAVDTESVLIYGGDQSYKRSDAQVIGFENLESLFT